MRIAIISDVHGNYPALVSVIEDAAANRVDKFIFIGDYIFDTPFSNEVVQLLMKMKLDNAYIIKGNKEGYLSNLVNDNQDNWTSEQFGGIYQTFRELQPDTYDFLINLDEEAIIRLNPAISVFAIHWLKFLQQSPKYNCSSKRFHIKMLAEPFTHEQFLAEFSDLINSDECRPYIEQIDANVILFGHDHLQSYAYCGEKLIINPGSCGQPLDFDTAAPYTILEITENRLNVIEKRAAYDVESAIEQAKKTVIYKKSKIWSELVFMAMRTGRDYFGIFFEIARQITLSKNESGGTHFSNSTWREAYEAFKRDYPQ